MGDCGVLILNDIGWAMGQSGVELYAGADYGQVSGQSTVGLLGQHLAGAVIGARPVDQAQLRLLRRRAHQLACGLRTAKVTLGFNLNASF